MPFPLPNDFPEHIVKSIEMLVGEVLYHKKSNKDFDTNILEKKIDKIFYDIYELTENEVLEIEM